jgi:hypothetical protein
VGEDPPLGAATSRPAGTPMTRAAEASVAACQPTVALTCPRVRPMTRRTAKSRRRRLTAVSSSAASRHRRMHGIRPPGVCGPLAASLPLIAPSRPARREGGEHEGCGGGCPTGGLWASTLAAP